MNLVPVADHPDADMWEASLQATPETALHDWAINWARQCPCIQLSWDSNPTEVPGCFWINPSLPAISKLPDCSNRSRVLLRTATPRSEYLSDREIHLVLRQTTDFSLWVLHPSTGLPTPFDSAILTIPAALQLLEATHLISYERGLLCIPPRRRDEPEPRENHPIMQSLLKRLQSKWRTHRAQATTLPTAPKPQPRQATPAQNQAATTWLLTPQTVHIGLLSVCYRPSPTATYALLSSWQSTLKKLCPDNIGKWIRNWLHVYPSLHLEVGQTSQAQESQWWWSEWLTHLTHKRIQSNLDECPNPHSPEAVSTFLQRRMDVTDVTTRQLLKELLEEQLKETPGYLVQTPSREHLCTTIQALEDDILLTHPPPLPLHLRRALLAASANWNWTQNMAGSASLHSTDALQHAPFTPTMVMTLCQAVTSTGVLHTLHRGRSPHSNRSPLFVLHDAGPLICSHVIDQIITAIAKKFNDTLSLYNIIWDCNINSSSIALVATPKGHPPRRHATKKKHKHDKRDP
jgi:hypothetical protein